MCDTCDVAIRPRSLDDTDKDRHGRGLFLHRPAAFVIAALFLFFGTASLVISTSMASLSVGEYGEQFDPQGDVLEIASGDQVQYVSGHPDLDILKIAAAFDDKNTPLITSDDSIVLTMTVKGSILDDPDVIYAFLLDTDSGSYAAIYNNSAVKVLDLSTGEPVPGNPLPVVSGGSLSVTIPLVSINSPTKVTNLQAIAADQRDPSMRYGDQAPDKIVKITSPSEGAVIWSSGGTYTFRGVCHKSISDIAKVEVSVDDGAWQTVATGDQDSASWTYSLNIAAMSGQHTISARATDVDGHQFTDTLVFYVNQEYVNPDNRPVLPSLPDFHSGDVFVYEAEGGISISGLDISSTVDMNITVHNVENVTVNGQTYRCIRVHTSERGTALMGVFEVEQTVEQDSWRLLDSQSSSIKEYTVTTQAVLKDGNEVNSASTYTNLTYESPFDFLSLPRRVGDWWSVTVSADQQTTVVDANGEKNGPNTSKITRTLVGEVLREETIQIMGTAERCLVFKTSNMEGNESAYMLMYFSSSYPVPVKIENYNSDRELIATFTLSERAVGSGVYPTIVNVSLPGGSVTAGEKVVFEVSVVNQGDVAEKIWARLVVDGKEVDNRTTSDPVPSGSLGTIRLEWTPEKPGKYVVVVETEYDSETFQLSVEEKQHVLPFSPLILGVAVIVILAVVLFFFFQRRRSGGLFSRPTKKGKKIFTSGKEKKKEKEMAGEEGVALEVGTEMESKEKQQELSEEKTAGKPEKIEEPEATAEAGGGESIIEISIGGEPGREGGDKKTGASEEKRVEKEKPGKEDVREEKTKVKCPKCGTVTAVVIKKKPYRFKCPECGARLVIK